MAKTSDDYRPCVVIFPSGVTRKGNVLHVNLMQLETAVETLKTGKIAWVMETDAEQVLSQWQGCDVH